MIKYLGLALLIFFNIFCKDLKNKNEERIALVKKTISAIKDYDTLQLYKIVDTNYYFSISGSENFLTMIDYTYNRLKSCTADYENIKETSTSVNTTEYIVSFCRENHNTSKNQGFDLVFTFANYANENQIRFIELIKSFSETDSPFSPPIKPNKKND